MNPGEMLLEEFPHVVIPGRLLSCCSYFSFFFLAFSSAIRPTASMHLLYSLPATRPIESCDLCGQALAHDEMLYRCEESLLIFPELVLMA